MKFTAADFAEETSAPLKFTAADFADESPKVGFGEQLQDDLGSGDPVRVAQGQINIANKVASMLNVGLGVGDRQAAQEAERAANMPSLSPWRGAGELGIPDVKPAYAREMANPFASKTIPRQLNEVELAAAQEYIKRREALKSSIPLVQGGSQDGRPPGYGENELTPLEQTQMPTYQALKEAELAKRAGVQEIPLSDQLQSEAHTALVRTFLNAKIAPAAGLAALEATGRGDSMGADLQRALLQAAADKEAQLQREDTATFGNTAGSNFRKGAMQAVAELPLTAGFGTLAKTTKGAVALSALAAGGLAGGNQLAQDLAAGRSVGESLPFALSEGAIEGAITRLFGATGTEAVFAQGGVKGLARRILYGIGAETTEEGTVEVAHQINQYIQRNPNKTLDEAVGAVWMSMLIGGTVGGGVNAAMAGAEKTREILDNRRFDRASTRIAQEAALEALDVRTTPGNAQQRMRGINSERVQIGLDDMGKPIYAASQKKTADTQRFDPETINEELAQLERKPPSQPVGETERAEPDIWADEDQSPPSQSTTSPDVTDTTELNNTSGAVSATSPASGASKPAAGSVEEKLTNLQSVVADLQAALKGNQLSPSVATPSKNVDQSAISPRSVRDPALDKPTTPTAVASAPPVNGIKMAESRQEDGTKQPLPEGTVIKAKTGNAKYTKRNGEWYRRPNAASSEEKVTDVDVISALESSSPQGTGTAGGAIPFDIQVDKDAGSVRYVSQSGQTVGRLETITGLNGELVVENHAVFDEARGAGLGGQGIQKLQAATGKTIVSDQYPSGDAVKMWERLGAKREKVMVGDPAEPDTQYRYVLRPKNQKSSSPQGTGTAAGQVEQPAPPSPVKPAETSRGGFASQDEIEYRLSDNKPWRRGRVVGWFTASKAEDSPEAIQITDEASGGQTTVSADLVRKPETTAPPSPVNMMELPTQDKPLDLDATMAAIHEQERNDAARAAQEKQHDAQRKKEQSQGITEADGILHTLAGQGVRLPYFAPGGLVIANYRRLKNKLRGNGILSSDEKQLWNKVREQIPDNFEDQFGVDGYLLKEAYAAAEKAGIASAVFARTDKANLRYDNILSELPREMSVAELLEEVTRLSNQHLANKGKRAKGYEGLTDREIADVKRGEQLAVDQAKVLEDFGNQDEPKTPTAVEQSARTKQDAETLRRIVSSRPGLSELVGLTVVGDGAGTLRPGRGTESGGTGQAATRRFQSKDAAELERLFGVRIILVRRADGIAFNGYFARGEKTILIDADTQHPLLAVAGHELLHHIKQTHPGLYADLVERLSPMVSEAQLESFRNRLSERGQGGLSNAGVSEELIADFIGDNFLRPEFWNDLANRDPNLFKRLARIVKTWLEKLIAKAKAIRGFESSQHFSDLEQAREVVADVLARAARETQFAAKGVPGQEVEGEAFSKPDIAQDERYMAAVKSGDMKVVQRLVDEAAKKAGYSPQLFFHGTRRKFNVFDAAANTQNDFGRYGKGFYFTKDKYTAAIYAGRDPFSGKREVDIPKGSTIHSVYLDIKRPKTIEARDITMPETAAEAEATTQKLMEEGYDGVIGVVFGNVQSPSTEYVVFSPSQIKSADPITRDDNGNVIPLSERFNPESDDIRFSKPPIFRASNATLTGPGLVDMGMFSKPQTLANELSAQKRSKTSGKIEIFSTPDMANSPVGYENGRLVVSTRQPSAVGTQAANKVLTSTMADMMANAEHTHTIAELFRGYSMIRNGKRLTDQQVLRQAVDMMKGNLRFLWDLFPAKVRERSMKWYDGAHSISEDLSQKHDFTINQTAGALAALSPKFDWFRNVSWGKRIVGLYRDLEEVNYRMKSEIITHLQYADRWGTFENTLKLLRKNGASNATITETIAKHEFKWNLIGRRTLGKRWSELDDEGRAIMIRGVDDMVNVSTYEIVAPEGYVLDWARTKEGMGKLSPQSYENMAAAIAILRDGSAENIHVQLGQAHKVRNFFGNISSPNSRLLFTTVDTHANAANMLLPLAGSSPEVKHSLSGPDTNSTGLIGTYAVHMQPYLELAEELRIFPRQLQSVTWEVIRELFSPESKRGDVVELTRSVWKDYNNGLLNEHETRKRILEIAAPGGISLPSWVEAGRGKAVKGHLALVDTGLGTGVSIGFRSTGEYSKGVARPDSDQSGASVGTAGKRHSKLTGVVKDGQLGMFSKPVSAAQKREKIVADAEKAFDAAQEKNKAVVDHSPKDESDEYSQESWSVYSPARGNDRNATIFKDENSDYEVSDENGNSLGWRKDIKDFDRALSDAKDHVESGGSQEDYSANADARSELLHTIDLPPDFRIKDIQDTKWGSVYYLLQKKVGQDEDGEWETEDYKVSIRNHEPSPFREKEFGENDAYFEVPKDATPKDISDAVAKVERFAQRRSDSEELGMFSKPEQTNTPEFKRWFGDSKVVDVNGDPLVVKHGTSRADRVGWRFRKTRATSGPMPFFTDSGRIAEGYTKKTDTSLERPEDYRDWFLMKRPGVKGEANIREAWNYLTPEQKRIATERLPTTGYTDAYQGEGAIVHTSKSIMGEDSVAWELKQAKGNALEAAKAIWLDGGNLFNREAEFLDVLKAMGVEGFRLDDPNATFPKVYDVFLSIQNPLVTTKIPADVMAALEARSRRQGAPKLYGADAWDKNTRGAADWMKQLREDEAKGINSMVWTSIPDWVTDTLKRFGYDGIHDIGGKMGGKEHSVWIPFDDRQVKSATDNVGTFDPDEADIRFSKPTGIKNAAMEDELADVGKLGLPGFLRTERKSNQTLHDTVTARIADEPGWIDTIIEREKKQPSSLTDEEVFALSHRLVELSSAHSKASRKAAAANDAGDMDTVVESGAQANDLSDKIKELADITKESGTIAGRALQARARLFAEDFSLVAMEAKKREANDWAPLTPEQRADIQKQHDAYEAKIAELEQHLEETTGQLIDEELRRAKAEEIAASLPRYDARVIHHAEQFALAWHKVRLKEEADLMAMLKDSETGGMFSKPSIGDRVTKLARYIVEDIVRGVKKAEILEQLKNKFGASVEAKFEAIWAEANTQMEKSLSKADKAVPDIAEKIKRVIKRKDAAEREAEARNQIETMIAKGEAGAIFGAVQKMIRSIVEQNRNITREGLIDEVHNTLKEFLPGITRLEAMDAISGRGRFTLPSSDEVSTIVRDLKAQTRLVGHQIDVQAKRPLPRTGFQPGQQSDAVRREAKILEELKRRFGVVVSDPTKQLASVLTARKTYYRNRLADMAHEIKTRELTVKTKSPEVTDTELEALKAEYKALKEEHDSIFTKPGLTDAQRLELSEKAADRHIAELERQLRTGEIFAPGKKPAGPTSAALEAKKARIEALKAEREWARDLLQPKADQAASELVKRGESLSKKIDEVRRQLREGDVFPKGKTLSAVEKSELIQEREAELADLIERRKWVRDQLQPKPQPLDVEEQRRADALDKRIEAIESQIENETVFTKGKTPRTDTPENQARLAKLEELKQQRQFIRERLQPKPEIDRVAQALKARQASLTRQIADYADRLARGDFAKRTRKVLDITEDAKAMALMAQRDAIKKRFEKGVFDDRMARRTKIQKLYYGIRQSKDAFVNIMSSGDLSAPRQLFNYFLDASTRLATSPRAGLEMFKQPLGKMFQAAWSEEKAGAIEQWRLNQPNAKSGAYKIMGIEFSDLHAQNFSKREEFAHSILDDWAALPFKTGNAAKSVITAPGKAGARLVRFSNRAFISALNVARVMLANELLKANFSHRAPTDAELRAIGNLVNLSTGRGAMNTKVASVTSNVLWSPKLAASRLQVLIGQPLWGKAGREGGGTARKMVLQWYVRQLVAAALLATIVRMFKDDEDELSSSDAGKVKRGRTRIDPWMGYAQFVVLADRLIESETTSTTTGKTRKLAGGDNLEVIGRFLANKTRPDIVAIVKASAYAFDTARGEEKPRFTGADVVQSAIPAPLALQEVIAIMRENGMAEGAIIQVLAQFGVGVSVYEDREKQK